MDFDKNFDSLGKRINSAQEEPQNILELTHENRISGCESILGSNGYKILINEGKWRDKGFKLSMINHKFSLYQIRTKKLSNIIDERFNPAFLNFKSFYSSDNNENLTQVGQFKHLTRASLFLRFFEEGIIDEKREELSLHSYLKLDTKMLVQNENEIKSCNVKFEQILVKKNFMYIIRLSENKSCLIIEYFDRKIRKAKLRYLITAFNEFTISECQIDESDFWKLNIMLRNGILLLIDLKKRALFVKTFLVREIDYSNPTFCKNALALISKKIKLKIYDLADLGSVDKTEQIFESKGS